MNVSQALSGPSVKEAADPAPSRPSLGARSSSLMRPLYRRYASEFRELEVLGRGSFGEVRRVQHLLDGQIYAVKRIRLNFDQSLNEKIIREASLLSKLHHPHIVRYYSAWIEGGELAQGTHAQSQTGLPQGSHLPGPAHDRSDPRSLHSDSAFRGRAPLTVDDSASESRAADPSLGALDSQSSPVARRRWAREPSAGLEEEEEEEEEEEDMVDAGDRSLPSLGGLHLSTLTPSQMLDQLYGAREPLKEEDCEDDDSSVPSGADGDDGAEEADMSASRDRSLAAAPGTTEPSEASHLQLECNACHCMYSDWDVSEGDWSLLDVSLQALNLCERCYLASMSKLLKVDVKEMQVTFRRKIRRPLFLFIQMEDCGPTLKQQLRAHPDWTDGDRWSLFRQIVSGLLFMHAHHTAHRDLKPSNIFCTDSKLVKIGDLGLATTVVPASKSADRRASQSPQLLQAAVPAPSPPSLLMRAPPPLCRTCSVGGIDYADRMPVEPSAAKASGCGPAALKGEFTQGVGTFFYTAPEVSAPATVSGGVRYDERCDLYSLGVILLEIFHGPRMETEMERQVTLGALRQGIIPADFEDRWPRQAGLIRLLLSPDPQLRPSAAVLLGMIPSLAQSASLSRIPASPASPCADACCPTEEGSQPARSSSSGRAPQMSPQSCVQALEFLRHPCSPPAEGALEPPTAPSSPPPCLSSAPAVSAALLESVLRGSVSSEKVHAVAVAVAQCEEQREQERADSERAQQLAFEEFRAMQVRIKELEAVVSLQKERIAELGSQLSDREQTIARQQLELDQLRGFR